MDYLRVNTEVKSTRASILVVLLFIIGMAFPTSMNGNISTGLAFAGITIFAALILLLIFSTQNINLTFFMLFLAINLLMWIFTLFNSETNIDLTQSITFTMLTLLFCINFNKINIKNSIFSCFTLINIMVILIGWGMVLKFQWLGSLFINFYTAYYPELVINMLSLGKPVIVFATHSTAAFYLFIFFYLNFKTFDVLKQRRYLLYAINYLLFCYLMESNTGYVFVIFGVVLLAYKAKRKYLVFATSAVALTIIFYLNDMSLASIFGGFEKFYSSSNGIISRYAADGSQMQNIMYIIEHPFSPVGFYTDSDYLTFYDSGIVSFTLMGTLAVTFLIYTAMYLFFKINSKNRNVGLILFITFLFFEVGFNNLLYFRTMFILPFIILYLNYLEDNKAVTFKEEVNEKTPSIHLTPATPSP